MPTPKSKRDARSRDLEIQPSRTTSLQATINKSRLESGYPLATGKVSPEQPRTRLNDPVENVLRTAARFVQKTITNPSSPFPKSNEAQQREDRDTYESTPEGNVTRGKKKKSRY